MPPARNKWPPGIHIWDELEVRGPVWKGKLRKTYTFLKGLAEGRSEE